MERERLGRRRESLDWTPQWEGVVEGWTRNFVKRNLWRLQGQMDHMDLMQEGFVMYATIEDRYPEVIEPRHFVALYKSAFRNCVYRLAERRASRYEISGIRIRSEDDEEQDFVETAPSRPDGEPELELRMLLEDAPPYVEAVILKLLAQEQAPVYVTDEGVRETTRQRWARLLGVPPEVDLPTMFWNWINGVVQPA